MYKRSIFRTLTLLGLVLSAVSLMLAMPAVAKADSPISYWKLDETSGPPYDDFYDVQDGVCPPGECPVLTTTAVVSNAQVFSSITKINVSDNLAFDWNASDSFSIEFWMKGIPGQTCTGGDEVIIGRVGGSSDPLWSLGCTDTNGYAYFHLSDTGGISTTLESTKIITNGVWHHVVGIRDGVNDINRLYVDGQEVVSETITYSNDFASTAELNIGWINIGSGFHFNGTIDEIALYDVALSETEIRTHYYLARGYVDSCTAPVEIMPLGDSITQGSASGVPDLDKQISYRKDLWDSLAASMHNIEFVGSRTNGEFYLTEGFDPNHQGVPGWRDDQIANNIYDEGQQWLINYPADVVLLHIGTNGLNANPGDVEDILDEIDDYETDNNTSVTVILARIINRRDGSPTTTQFNDNVEAMALARIANGDKIIIVDMEDGAGINYSQYPPGDMWDNLHPFATGYAKMAAVWYEALDGFLPVCPPVAPKITSTPVTVATTGQPYTYNVDASGFPVPTYTLTAFPTGMTINSTTGLIEWTPAISGSFPVTVNANNSEGEDTQPFIIEVSDSVTETSTCPADLISYWKLDETSGSTFYDSYDGNDGSCSGGGSCPAPTTGMINGAQTFDGNDEIDVPDDGSLDWSNTDSFAIELWAQTTQNCSGNKVFVGKYRDTGAGERSSWWVGCGGSNETVFSLRDSDNKSYVVYGTSTINDGDWHHIVAVRDYNTNKNYLYIDGTLEYSQTTAYTGHFSNSRPLNIGYFINSYHLNGKLDEIALYNDALSQSEIQQHYNKGRDKLGLCEVPSITIVKTPDTQTVVSNSTVTFTITVTNTNDVTLTTVSVTDPLTPDCDQTIGDLDAGDDYSYTCAANNVTADFTNIATATGSTFFGGTVVSDTDTADVEVLIPSITIAKTPDIQAVVSGSPVTFTISVTNTGEVTLTNIFVTDPLAPDCDRTTGTIGDLAPTNGTSYSCTLANVTTDFTNSATVTGTTTLFGGIVVSDTDTADVEVLNPAITIAKTPDTQTVVNGSPVTFTISITNTGEVTLTNIFVTDPLAPDCDRTTGTIGDLAPTNGTSYTCTLANVTTAFTNSATVTGSTLFGGIVVSDTDTAVVTVDPGPSPGSGTIYLPIIFGGHTPTAPDAPDLIVENLIVTSNSVQVVIRNQGNAPVLSADEFWVDLYIDPNPVPTGVNQVWNDGRSTQGIVWGVTAPALPLTPGNTITLTYGDAYTWPYPVSNFPGTFIPGMVIYAQVDSANANDPIYGAVKENHELTGGAYNNITGVVFSASTTASSEVGGTSPSVGSGASTLSSNLPPRP